MADNSAIHSETNPPAPEGRKALAHILPVRMLLLIWAMLVVLTAVTVAASMYDFGQYNLWVALAIALVKATFVALYFMHLRYEHPIFGLILVSALVFFMLFVSVTMLDSQSYAPNLIEGYAPRIIQ